FFCQGSICNKIITNRPSAGKIERTFSENTFSRRENAFLPEEEADYAFIKRRRTPRSTPPLNHVSRPARSAQRGRQAGPRDGVNVIFASPALARGPEGGRRHRGSSGRLRPSPTSLDLWASSAGVAAPVYGEHGFRGGLRREGARTWRTVATGTDGARGQQPPEEEGGGSGGSGVWMGASGGGIERGGDWGCSDSSGAPRWLRQPWAAK
uniref:Uncharacterized protein n=1 Tax=Triticum urartu TaxID=4572 RepID=A0A8R7TU32_TRIUA